MTDDELIERMAEAIRATWADEDEYGDMTEAARAAIRVVLTAVADDLTARRNQTLPPFGISDPKGEAAARFALGSYAHYLRSLLPKDNSDA